MLRLAEFQVRLLLCRPDRKEALNGYSAMRLHWNCGCSATQDQRKKYLVEPCGYHRALLAHVTEDEERQYDSVAGDDIRLPHAL